MKVLFDQIKINVKPVDDYNHPDLLAHVSLTLYDTQARYFTVSGFTLRKSKYNGSPYLLGPNRPKREGGFFQFTLIENSLKKMIENEVLLQYDKETIPVVEEKEEN